jgi:hypothetical protein
MSRVGASRASAEAASEAAGRADRASDRQSARSKLTERPRSNKFVKPVPRDAAQRLRLRLSGWRICAHSETIWAERMRPSTNSGHRAGTGLPQACGGRLCDVALLLGRWDVCGRMYAARLPAVVARTLLGR